MTAANWPSSRRAPQRSRSRPRLRTAHPPHPPANNSRHAPERFAAPQRRSGGRDAPGGIRRLRSVSDRTGQLRIARAICGLFRTKKRRKRPHPSQPTGTQKRPDRPRLPERNARPLDSDLSGRTFFRLPRSPHGNFRPTIPNPRLPRSRTRIEPQSLPETARASPAFRPNFTRISSGGKTGPPEAEPILGTGIFCRPHTSR